MIILPQSTVFGKKVPKETFFKKMEIIPSIRRSFVNDIEQIIWQYKLSTSTLNVGKGIKVVEIEVIFIYLKKKNCNYSVYEFIDKNLPHHILFVLVYKNESQILINYKERNETLKGKFKVIKTYKTDWIPENEITISINGLDMDKVYENFVYQVAGSNLIKEEEHDIKEVVEVSLFINKVQKKIKELESKIRIERQFNTQLKYSNELKKLKNQLQNLNNGKT